MEYLYEELYRLCGKSAHVTDPNEKLEIEYEIENVRQAIEEGAWVE